jgi:hypothetical protein
MFWLMRRLFWFGTGASMGFGGAMWIRHRVRRAVARYRPARVSAEVGTGVRRVGNDVRDAISEGRAEMHTREAELREELAPGKGLRSLG